LKGMKLQDSVQETRYDEKTKIEMDGRVSGLPNIKDV
jgi:hypothetical protein